MDSSVDSLTHRLKSMQPIDALAQRISHVAGKVAGRKGLTETDTIWSVVGTASSTGARDVSTHKRKHFVKATRPNAE